MNRKLGISHALPDGSNVIHSAISGKNALGRTTDVLVHWCKMEMELDQKCVGDLRILTQTLLEFATPDAGNNYGQIEIGFSQHLVIIATRFEFRGELQLGQLEKDLTQYWLNVEEVKLFKRVLLPHDRVEVRYHSKLNLMEWRVYRSTRADEVVDHNPSFAVIVDDSAGIDSGKSVYTNAGDLPFQDWMTEVYHSRPEPSRAGDMYVQEGGTQDEIEWARVIVEREAAEIEQQITFTSGVKQDDVTNLEHLAKPGDEALKQRELQQQFSDEKIRELLSEQVDLKDSVKNFVLEMKQQELRSTRVLNTLYKKIQQMELLLHRKELVNQRNQTERKVLQHKLESERKKKKSDKNDNFREKALEMFEMLKRVKEENSSLEKMMIELRSRDAEKPVDQPLDSLGQKQLDEMGKKLERTLRALDSEKLKVKSLSERAIVAEKDAQATGPLVQDLEAKVEHALKVAQQHKKDTDVVKQKLIQADAEKNKIKNELTKAQAQIQTLMKRQAA